MGGVELTPVLVAIISLIGTFGTGAFAYVANRRTQAKVHSMPSSLVQEFSKLKPGIDTVEKVIEMLYAEIARLKDSERDLYKEIERLRRERRQFLDEIEELKQSLADTRRKLAYVEARVRKSIVKENDNDTGK